MKYWYEDCEDIEMLRTLVHMKFAEISCMETRARNSAFNEKWLEGAVIRLGAENRKLRAEIAETAMSRFRAFQLEQYVKELKKEIAKRDKIIIKHGKPTTEFTEADEIAHLQRQRTGY